jgi:hypothetical protein
LNRRTGHETSPPDSIPENGPQRDKAPLLYWRPVIAAAVIALALVMAALMALKPARRTAESREQQPVPREAEPPEPVPAFHGTQVPFAPTPAEATRLARKEEKLILLLHLSGHFEDPGFT